MNWQLSKAEQEKTPLEDWRTEYAQRLRVEIAADWCVKNVGDICSIRTGKLDVNQADENGAYPFFTCAEKVYRINTPAFDAEAVLLAGNGDFNVKYYKGKFNAYQRTYVLSDLQVDGKYLYYYIFYRLRDLTGDSRGSTIKYIRLGDVRDYPVPIAPLDQQKRIVAEIEKQFSRLDEAVANLKRVKANLKRYKAAVLKAAVEGRLVETEAELARREGRSYETGAQLLQRILETRRSQWQGKGKYKEPTAPDTTDLPELPEGWVWASAVQACEQVVDCHNKTAPYTDNGITLVRTSNIRDGKLLLDDVRYVDQPTYDFWSRRCPPEPGDVLFTREAPMGEAAIIPDEMRLCMGQRMMLLRPSDAIEVTFLLSTLASPITRHLIDRVAVGSGVKHLRVGDVELLPIPIPPRAEQLRIVAETDRRLSIIHETETQVNANLKRAEGFRQSILSRAFTGFLTGLHAQ